MVLLVFVRQNINFHADGLFKQINGCLTICINTHVIHSFVSLGALSPYTDHYPQNIPGGLHPLR